MARAERTNEGRKGILFYKGRKKEAEQLSPGQMLRCSLENAFNQVPDECRSENEGVQTVILKLDNGEKSERNIIKIAAENFIIPTTTRRSHLERKFHIMSELQDIKNEQEPVTKKYAEIEFESTGALIGNGDEVIHLCNENPFLQELASRIDSAVKRKIKEIEEARMEMHRRNQDARKQRNLRILDATRDVIPFFDSEQK